MSFKPITFGPFILLDKIAAGGMAELYLARLQGVGGFEKLIAIKKILPAFTANKEFVSMFIEEAKLTVQLTHANIVQVYDFGEVNKELYLAMEFVEGRNVRQLLAKLEQEKQTCPIEIACHIVAEICRGLDYAHNREDKKTHTPLDIIHRDISPQNVIVSYDGEIKIIDFGIAKAASKVEETKAGVLKGKFGYMSPEQALGEGVDSRTDIFSAGIILFELLTGERLFASESDLETIKKIQRANIPPPSKYNPAIPKQLEDIVLKALAKDRNERFERARDLQRALSHFIYLTNPHFVHHDLAEFLRELFYAELQSWKERLTAVQRESEEISKKLVQPSIPVPTPPLQKRQRPLIKRAAKGEPTVVRLEKHPKTESTKITPQREKTAVRPKPRFEFPVKSIAQKAITLFAIFILGLILAYAIVLFIEGPSPERKIAEELIKPKTPKVEEPQKEGLKEEEPAVEEPKPSVEEEEEEIETAPPPPSPPPPAVEPKPQQPESRKGPEKKGLVKRGIKKSTPIPIETLIPDEIAKSGFLLPKISTGILYVDNKLIPYLLDPIELKPGSYQLLLLDPALDVKGEKSVTIEAGKTLEVTRGDFVLRPIEKSQR